MGKIGDTFYLVGGQKFDGLYNPMGHMTFTQAYSNQIRKFKISNSESLLSISNDTTLLGHIYGGILSPSLNPFGLNQTSTTSADPAIYAVNLISKDPTGIYEIDGDNPYSMTVYPNPISKEITMEIYFDKPSERYYFITNSSGQIIEQGSIISSELGLVKKTISIDENLPIQSLFLTVVIDNKYYLTKKLLKR